MIKSKYRTIKAKNRAIFNFYFSISWDKAVFAGRPQSSLIHIVRYRAKNRAISHDIARFLNFIVRYRTIYSFYRAISHDASCDIARYRTIFSFYRTIKLFSQADLNPH